jgi:hypothetical protein
MADAVFQRVGLLRKWIRNRVSADSLAWFDEQIAKLNDKGADKDLYLALGYATRRIGKRDLDLSEEELAAAEAARAGWDPSDWSTDQAARLAFVLAGFDGNETRFKARIEQLFRTADRSHSIEDFRSFLLQRCTSPVLGRERAARCNLFLKP